jgi:outer membrane protein TolC
LRTPTLLALVAALSAGAASAQEPGFVARRHEKDVAPAPSVPWMPGEGERPPVEKREAANLPPEFLVPGATVTLPQLVDLALTQNPLTRAAWMNAKAAAGELGTKRAAYLPTVEVDANVLRQKQAAVGGKFITQQTTYGPSVLVSWALLDFGTRAADVEEARQALIEADYAHDQTIQDVVLRLTQAYYQYQAAKALAAAYEVSLNEAETSADAAEERRKAGVATIADVLQSKTARSQALLNLQTAQGLIQTLRGGLATAAGVPANIPVDTAPLPDTVDVDAALDAIEPLLDKAVSERADLNAARAEKLKTEAHVKSVRASGLPSLGFGGSVNRTYYTDTSIAKYSDNWSGQLLVRFPVFTGFEKSEELYKAKAEAGVAAANEKTLADQVILQVWTSYYSVKTAAQRVKTARDLLASAAQSADVGSGRYKAGVGTVLDLLTAQGALASARAQDVEARTDWLTAMAQLAHDIGGLGPGPAAAVKGTR